MGNSTLVLLQKLNFNIAPERRVYHTTILKIWFVLLGCFSFIPLGLAQSGTIQFDAVSYTVNEADGSLTLELQRVGGSAGEITIDFQTFDATATASEDYVGFASPIALTWVDGNTSPKTATLPILSDALLEGDETFIMTISSTNPDWVGSPSNATVTIIDTPPPSPGTIQLDAANYTVNEADGSLTLELQRVGGSAGEITIDFQTFDATATASEDYVGFASPIALTWVDGNTSPKTATLPILSDALLEGDETFIMTISSTNPDWVGTPSTATVTIIDTPPPSPGTIQFDAANYTVNEADGSLTLELQRVGGSAGEITIDFQTFDATATASEDYVGFASPIALTWVDGNTSPKTATLPILSDALLEGDETFTMTISSTNPEWVGTPSTATVTIIDTPPPSPGTIQFDAANYSVNEADGSVTLELQRVGGSQGEITIDIQTFDGSATISQDYAGIPSPIALTWVDGNTSPKTATLPILSDALLEGDETFTMTISSTNPDWVGSPSNATVTIIDTPPPSPGTIQFDAANYSVNEADGSVTLELQRVGGSQGEITIDIQTFDGSATISQDYAGIPSPLALTWVDGSTASKTVTLPILSDALLEGDETFTMTISSTNPDWVGSPSNATVTIIDTPPPSPGTIQFDAANYSVNEADGSVTLELQRVGGSQGEITIDIQTFDGSATISQDYTGIPSPLALTWVDGNTASKTVTLPILSDVIAEPDETFTMTISSTNPEWVGTPSTAMVTIGDTPPPAPGTIQFDTANYSVNEADGSVTLELQRVGGSQGEITIDIQTFDGSATISQDYTGIPSPLALTWVDGSTASKTVTLPILSDAIAEPDETFTMTISSTNPEWVGTPSTVTVTIKDSIGSGDCDITVTSNAGADQIACGGGSVAIAATTSGAGMWSGGSGNFGDATMASTTYTPNASELGTTVSLSWTTSDPDGDGPCVSVNDTMEIAFNEAPNAGENNDTAVCEGTIVDLLSLVSEAGGTFSGLGVSGNTFDTTALPAGNYQIIYTVSSGNSCPDDSATITVTIADDSIIQSCEVLDIDYCDPNKAPFYNFFWDEMEAIMPGSEYFSQNATHSLSFTEFTDGTALIQGSTQSGTCSAQLYIVLKDIKDWAMWSADGGEFKAQGCNPGLLVKEDLRYYVVDGSKSTITVTGGDCLEEGTFVITQRPDPDNPSTSNYGVHVGPGGALYDSDTSAEGLAGWAWMGPQEDKRRWKIDFNFHINCDTDSECKPNEEVCDGVDNDGDGDIDEGFDSDNDGTPDCDDVEECDGLDNDGDGAIDEGFDSDKDGTPDCDDVEECDGLDNDGDGDIDEGFDSDNDGTPDCDDEEVCDGLDNDGDGDIDEGFDSDNDGTPDCDDEEVCDGLDNDGDGAIDEGFDSDNDGTADCDDVEECDGLDNDGDGAIDEGFDSDNDGTPDCDDEEECDGLDNDGDGAIDEGFDSDNDGTPDCDDEEECDGLDNDGDGAIDEGFDSDNDGTPDCDDEEECDGLDNDGDGAIDEGFDSDNDGTPNCDDEEECDGLDNDGDGAIDEGFDSDNDGTPNCDDEEECDGLDNDGDGAIDEGFDSDNDGTPDCDDVEECDGLDNDGDGDIDEELDCNDTPPAGCQTAYARYSENNSCFIDDGLGNNRWGWTNYLPTMGSYTLDLYTGAGQCDIAKGEKSGEVSIEYGRDTITVTVTMLNGFTMTEAQLYVGQDPYPNNGGRPTVASGQFPYKTGDLDNVANYPFDPIAINHLDTGIYVILHAVTCEDLVKKAPIKTSVKTYHKPFENTINLDIDIPYDAVIDVQFMDMSGKLVMQKTAGTVTKGRNIVPIEIHKLATAVHIMMINTGKEVIRKKVYFHK